MNDDTTDNPAPGLRPSRSAMKREAEALQKLGEHLLSLPETQRARIPMSERLEDAVSSAAAMPSRGARRRQLRRIGRLMAEEDVDAITSALTRLQAGSVAQTALHHRAERWRDRLLTEGDEALTELVDTFPQAEPGRLRRLVRGARREAERDRPPRSGRLLYRVLREVLAE